MKAAATMIATGGFRASPDLFACHIHRQAETMLLRSNPPGDWAGLRPGEAAGGEVADIKHGLHGDLANEPRRWDYGAPFVVLSHCHNEHAPLIDEAGTPTMTCGIAAATTAGRA